MVIFVATGVALGAIVAALATWRWATARKDELSNDRIAAIADARGGAMFERFTDRARRVLAFANQEAQLHNHEVIGSEHILLGLIKEGGGVGVHILRAVNVDLRVVRQEVENLLTPGRSGVMVGKLPQTPRAKKVIEHGIGEARGFHHKYVGTEHLLLGLLRDEGGIPQRVLNGQGVELESARATLLRLLDER